jgi:predicted metal-binding membrane protein
MRLAPASLLRGERAVVLLALVGVTAIAWLYLIVARQNMNMPMPGMDDMPDMAMPFAAPWVFAMWWVMMLGMMLPSAAPMILTFAALERRKRDREQPYVPTAMFVAGYLIVWGGFSVAATAAQWALQIGALLSPMLSVHAAEACLPASLPLAVRLRAEPLA